MTKMIDMAGQKIGRLTVLARAKNTNGRQAQWECRCDCGSMVVTQGASLRSGHTTSCGCLQREATSSASTKHGFRQHPAYKVFLSAKRRCLNAKDASFKDYGGRGIEFRFSSFSEFWAHVGESWEFSLTIERIDNNGHYEAGNVRWATRGEQTRNQRTNVWVEFGGRRMVMADWAKEIGVSKATLLKRYKKFGNAPERLFSK